jgi:hypothetical protein
MYTMSLFLEPIEGMAKNMNLVANITGLPYQNVVEAKLHWYCSTSIRLRVSCWGSRE